MAELFKVRVFFKDVHFFVQGNELVLGLVQGNPQELRKLGHGLFGELRVNGNQRGNVVQGVE